MGNWRTYKLERIRLSLLALASFSPSSPREQLQPTFLDQTSHKPLPISLSLSLSGWQRHCRRLPSSRMRSMLKGFALDPPQYLLPGMKGSILVIRSDRRVFSSFNARPRGGNLIANAVTVATKADALTSSTASKPGHELLLFEALREGLEEEMDLDPQVCVMGEDVDHYGGSYKVTKGLAAKYGDLRILDTPIAENSFTGMGIGSAMTGLRPVVEGMNRLSSCWHSIRYQTTGVCFITLLVANSPSQLLSEGLEVLGCKNTHSTWSHTFQPIPGLLMVSCSTPYNAKGLMKAAIRSENPVVLFEHVLLYNLKERIPDEEYVLCLEEAEMVWLGEHVTILTYSRMRYQVMQAAKTLMNKGYDPGGH